MTKKRIVTIAGLAVAIAAISDCTRWTTRYSGKDDQSNPILVNLDKMGEPIEHIKPVKGTVSFDQIYSQVTIDIQIMRDGRMVSFPGNGRFRINADE